MANGNQVNLGKINVRKKNPVSTSKQGDFDLGALLGQLLSQQGTAKPMGMAGPNQDTAGSSTTPLSIKDLIKNDPIAAKSVKRLEEAEVGMLDEGLQQNVPTDQLLKTIIERSKQRQGLNVQQPAQQGGELMGKLAQQAPGGQVAQGSGGPAETVPPSDPNVLAGQPQGIDQQELLKRAGVQQGLLSSLLGRSLNNEGVQTQLANILSAQKALGEEPKKKQTLQEQAIAKLGGIESLDEAQLTKLAKIDDDSEGLVTQVFSSGAGINAFLDLQDKIQAEEPGLFNMFGLLSNKEKKSQLEGIRDMILEGTSINTASKKAVSNIKSKTTNLNSSARKQAEKALRDAGAPVTENNIISAASQLGL